MIQAKIAFLKSDYLASARYYEGMDGDVQVRIHLNLLKVRGGDLKGYSDLKLMQLDYPIKPGLIEMIFEIQNKDFVAMHVALALAASGLFILR